MRYGILIGTAIGCTMGNYIYHALGDRVWRTAFEWSVAQAIAIAVVAVNQVITEL